MRRPWDGGVSGSDRPCAIEICGRHARAGYKGCCRDSGSCIRACAGVTVCGHATGRTTIDFGLLFANADSVKLWKVAISNNVAAATLFA